MNITGNSDPGTSGVLSPFCKIDGFTFNESVEPDGFFFDFTKDMSKIIESEGGVYLDINCDTKEEYYKAIREFNNFNNDKVKVTVKLKDEDTVIFERGELDLTGNKAEYRQKDE